MLSTVGYQPTLSTEMGSLQERNTHTTILNSIKLFNLKGILYNFALEGLFLGFVQSLITR
jgi:hypothetical protein